jgi:hypothetical protein
LQKCEQAIKNWQQQVELELNRESGGVIKTQGCVQKITQENIHVAANALMALLMYSKSRILVPMMIIFVIGIP